MRTVASGGHTIVKVCGVTNAEDARVALAAGADWLGFVLQADSPRRVDAALAGEIVAGLGGAVAVAVMAGVGPEQALALAQRAGAARVQLHRVDPDRWPVDFPLPCAFSARVGADGLRRDPLPAEPHLILLDTAHATLAGGTGESFPWTSARELAASRPVMLAGGLAADNVAAAIAAARPFGVDAASRLERAPGLKDPDRVRRFVAAVRECDAGAARSA